MEVIVIFFLIFMNLSFQDNFSHDLVRYDTKSSFACARDCSAAGEYEGNTKLSDPLLQSYLSVRNEVDSFLPFLDLHGSQI
jgi:hypothetical protein